MFLHQLIGRTLTSSKDDPVGGSLTETAEEVIKVQTTNYLATP